MRYSLGLLLLGAIAFGACASGDDDAGPACETAGCRVAVADGDAAAADGDADAIRANVLVNAIALRCGLSPARVADLAVGGRDTLRDSYATQVTVQEILESVNTSTEGRSGVDCPAVITAYVVARGS